MFDAIIYLGFNSFKTHKRGVENVIELQSNALKSVKCYYISWGDTTKSYKFRKFRCIQIKNNIMWPIFVSFALYKIRKRNMNVKIHSHNQLMSAILFQRTDYLTVHDSLFFLKKSTNNKSSIIFYLIEKLAYLKSECVHFISEYTRLNSLFPIGKRSVVIPNSSNYESAALEFKINCTDVIRNDLKKYGEYILVVRSVEHRARFDLLIQLAQTNEFRNTTIIVAGKGPLLQYFRSIVKEKGIQNLIFLGYVSDQDLFSLYMHSKIVLMLAEYGEGFGLPIIEGYLFGKPVVASNKCAIPEFIADRFLMCENCIDDIVFKCKAAWSVVDNKYFEFYISNYSNATILNKYRSMYIGDC